MSLPMQLDNFLLRYKSQNCGKFVYKKLLKNILRDWSPLKLEYLDMTNAVVDLDSINAIIKHCKFLKSLSLESLTINDQTLYCVSLNKFLTTLNICMVEGITVDGLILILNSLKM